MPPSSDLTRSRPEFRQTRAVLDSRRAGVLLLGGSGTGKTALVRSVVQTGRADGLRVRLIGTAPTDSDEARAGVDGNGSPGDAVFSPAVKEMEHVGSASENHDDLLVCDDVDRSDVSVARALAEAVRTSSGRTVALLSARSAKTLPAPIATMLTDGLLEPVPLEPPPLDLLGRHLGSLLHGSIDNATVRELRRLSGGDLRLLHALFEDGLRDGTLLERNRVWSWNGDVEPGTRTSALINADLRARERNEVTVLELVALAQPLDAPSALATLDTLGVEPSTLDDLLQAGHLTAGRPDGDLRLAHPITARELRSSVPPARRRDLLRSLLDAHPQTVNPSNRIARVRWMLDCGMRPDVEELIRTTREAARLGRNQTVLELTHHLLDGGTHTTEPQLDARILRADAARLLGRHDLVRRDLTVVASHLSSTDDRNLRFEIACRRADLAQYIDDDPDRALEIIADELPSTAPAHRGPDVAAGDGPDGHLGADPPGDDDLTLAIRADIAVRQAWAGRWDTAVPAGFDLLGHPRVRDTDRFRLVTPIVLGLTARGRFREARTLLDDHRPSGRHRRIDARSPDVELRSARFHLLLGSGRLDEAGRLLVTAERTDDREYPAMRSIGRGQFAIARGRRTEAVSHLRNAVESLRLRDPIGFLPLAVSAASLAEALAGHTERARRLVDELPELPLGTCRALEGPIRLNRARASLLVASGCVHDQVRALIERAEQQGWALVELEARHLDAVLRSFGSPGPIGEDPIAAVRRCAAAVEAPIGPALGQHVETLLRHPGEPAATLTAVTAVGVPVLEPARSTRLTRRQEEVAQLAAAGMTSRDIADELFISVRTVDAHLRQIYLLLGVNRRGDLAGALAGFERLPDRR